MVGKEGAGARRKKEREKEGEAPERVAGKQEEKSERARGRRRWEEVRAREGRGGENASYSAQHPRWRWQRLPSSLKSIIKKYIRGHLRFSSAS